MLRNSTSLVEATLADADPEIDRKNAGETTDTLATPSLKRPATTTVMYIKNCPASPAFKTAPKIKKWQQSTPNLKCVFRRALLL